MRYLKGNQGFSLLESLFVLLCISLFFTVPFLTIKNWRDQMAIEQFFNQLERNIQMTHQSAIIEGKNTQIIQNESSAKISFVYYHHGEKYEKDLAVIDGLILRSNERIIFNTTKGNLQKIQTIKIEDHVNQQTVHYTFQLGSGKVIRSVKKL